ncbi:4Fe-4S dicluster domain-containing protein [Candidatus Bathyarchaeota archaeon]|nr:4Fe-4S dicluster domain-containing protein [Candidatus Bathyarchaeota archaeon]
MEYAVLVDPAKCIGCRACQVACKRWNNRKGESTTFNSEWTNPPKLSFNTYTHIKFKLEYNQAADETKWRFFNWRCMHCKEPACMHACPVNAITKYEQGPVVVDTNRCIGCKFCISACPFGIPQFDTVTEKVDKCTMCYDRVAHTNEPKEPACVQSCPTDALLFGPRDTILQKAMERKEELNGYVYGDIDNKPLGGTSFIYVLDTEPSAFGLPVVGEQLPTSVPVLKYSKFLLIPAAIGGLLYLISWRKRRMKEKEE